MKHALLSPSSSHRWIPCNGSVALSRGEPNPPSEYSDEGTAAHHLAAVALQQGVNAAAFRTLCIGLWGGGEGDDSECFERIYYPPPGPVPNPPPRATYIVNDEMCEPVQVYIDKVREYAVGREMFVEQRLSIESITGEKDAHGTSDVVIVDLEQEELQVHDLKYGMGHQVDATENPQLKIYGLAALAEFSYLANFKRVRFVIHQPRLGHLSEWDCSVEDLVQWAETVATPAAKRALYLYNLSAEGEADEARAGFEEAFKVGHHCRSAFCPARAKCPHLAAFVEATVGASFEDLDAVKSAARTVKMGTSSPELAKDIGDKLRAVDLIESFCKAVRAKGESMLIEASNSPEMIQALGFKLVQGRKGHRAWVDEVEAEAKLKSMRLKVDEMYSKSLMSPAGIEKVLKKSPAKWEALAPLIKQSDGKPSVEVATDPRPALVITPVIESFSNLDEQEIDTEGLL